MELVKKLTAIMRSQMMKFVGEDFDQSMQNAPRLELKRERKERGEGRGNGGIGVRMKPGEI